MTMPIRVFITDDHAVFRSGLRALLEREDDFTVVGEAENGSETIRMLSGLNADALIMDVSMPGLSGAETARTVRERHPQLPILVLSMHEDEYYLREFFSIGVRSYLLKKSTSTELFMALRAIHNGDYYVDSSLAGYVLAPFAGKKRAEKKTEILTSREQEICQLLAYGHTNQEIANNLNISVRTVDTHRANIMDKLDLKNRAELVRYAIDNEIMKF